MNIYLKSCITAALIVLISEIAKLNDKLGSLLASLPLMTFLTLFWLYFKQQGNAKIANHVYHTFWYVLPTLPMFYLFPQLLQTFGFWGAMVASGALTAVGFVILAMILKNFGIILL